jgi:hypothetical protein
MAISIENLDTMSYRCQAKNKPMSNRAKKEVKTMETKINKSLKSQKITQTLATEDPKIKGTVVSIFDRKNLPYTRLHKKKVCSRCKKYILGTAIEIRPLWDIETRRLNYYYAYHEKCLDGKKWKLKLNLFGHYFLWKIERLKKTTILNLIFKH